ncbi:MAG: hypothetical protein NUV94_00805 [Candidatus Acetothermia bacterium]|jgi:hypothetical protein|nr:hypothetical protein [Candidatus Acetothermia bacterium]
MRGIVFLSGSLLVVLIAAALAPLPVPWRLTGGALLLGLWGHGLWRVRRGPLAGNSPVRLLPGHALLFLGLGLVGARAALAAWLAVPPLTVALDLARPRSLAAPVYAILWLDLFAVLHQLVALGRGLSGPAFWAWSGGVAVVAIPFVARGVLRVQRAKG